MATAQSATPLEITANVLIFDEAIRDALTEGDLDALDDALVIAGLSVTDRANVQAALEEFTAAELSALGTSFDTIVRAMLA